MKTIFPAPITALPKAELPFANCEGYISQAEDHQILFMEFDEDAVVPEHSHESQWGVVLEGKIELTIDGVTRTYMKGDQYFIEKGIKHASKVYAGYADITFFHQKDRYSAK